MGRRRTFGTIGRLKHYTAVMLVIAMIFGQTVPAAAYTDTLHEKSDASTMTETVNAIDDALQDALDTAEGDTLTDEDVSDAGEAPLESIGSEPDGSYEELTDDEVILTEDELTEDVTLTDELSAPDDELQDPDTELLYNDGDGADTTGAYTLNAGLVENKDAYTYPGVYTVTALSSDDITDNMTIGIPSLSNEMLKDNPTTESPAIIMGAAVPYEEKTGPTEYTTLPGASLYAPYSYFRYEIIEEPNLNGTGTHKKMSGFDGTYIIIRVDVSNIINGAQNGSYLHVKQSNNKALMVKIGQDIQNGMAAFSDAMGSRTGAYLISDNKLVMKDETGAYKEQSYIDVIFLSSGTLVQGADTGGGQEDPKAPKADFPLSFYIDNTGDYDPSIEWNSSLGTAVYRTTGKPVTLTEEQTQNKITASDLMLDKYYDEKKAPGAAVSRYTVKGSDIELEMTVEGTGLGGTNEYWSLKKGMESQYALDHYSGEPLKLICEAPLLNSINVTGSPERHVILDVNSFDIQLANHSDSAALTVDGAKLTIQDTFNTTGAELAVGNNAKMLVTNGGHLVIAETAQLEVEYDAASTPAGSEPAKTYDNGVITVNNGGVIENNGIITVEGKEGKPQNPADAGMVVRDYKNAKLTVGREGTIKNNGCMLVNGELYNLGTIINSGKYSDTISSNDPDKGTFTYHKGLQLSWKDDITQGRTQPGALYNGYENNGDKAGTVYPEAKIENTGDIVMVPGFLANYATVDNKSTGTIYMAAVDEIVIPIAPYADKPLITEQRVELGYDEESRFINNKGATLINDGMIRTADVEIVSNGRTGDISDGAGKYYDDLCIVNWGDVKNSSSVEVNAIYTYGKVENTGSGKIDRIMLGCINGDTGSFTDESTDKQSKVYNASKTVEADKNVWTYAPMRELKISDETRIQSAAPDDTVTWSLTAGVDDAGSDILYSIDVVSIYSAVFIGRYDVKANEPVLISSNAMPDICGNSVYYFYNETAGDDLDSNDEHAVVRVEGSGIIKPAPMKGPGEGGALVYNGEPQQLVTAGSVRGGKILYNLDGGEFSEEIPTAVNAQDVSYNVGWKVVYDSGAESEFDQIKVLINKRKAYIAADHLVSLKGTEPKALTYVSYGILDKDKEGLNIRLNAEGLDMNSAGSYQVEIEYNNDPNYEITSYPAVYTVHESMGEMKDLSIQSVLTAYDSAVNVAHTISVNTVYNDNVDNDRKANIYYSLTESLEPGNYKEKGTTIAPGYGGIGVQFMYFYIEIPDGDDVYGSRPVVVVKGSQKAPSGVEGMSGGLIGSGVIIKGLVPFDSDHMSMEFRRADETEYKRAVFPMEVVPEGNYYVRLGGNERLEPSKDIMVSVVNTDTHTVKFDSKGGTVIKDAVGLIYGDTVPEPEDPSKSGYVFDGWFTNADCTDKYDFMRLVLGDDHPAVLYAGWEFAVPGVDDEDKDDFGRDIEGSQISVNRIGDGKVTVIVDGEPISEVTTGEDGKVTVKSQIWVGGLADEYRYTGTAIKPVIRVYDGLKKLTEKQDYSVSYKNNRNAAGSSDNNPPTITIRFKGSYKDNKSQTVGFTISPAVIGEDVEVKSIGAAVKSNNKKQTPSPLFIRKSTGKTINKKFFKVSYDRDVTLPGVYTAAVESNNANYTGKTEVKIYVADKDHLLDKAKVRIAKYVYTGTAVIPPAKDITLKIGGKVLEYGKDYEIDRVYNNILPGTATIVFRALSGNSADPSAVYVGTKKTTFKITKGRTITDEKDKGFSFVYDKTAPFAKGGSKPEVMIYDNGLLLEEKTDYTLTYKNNKAVTNGETAEIKVRGKGNYKGSVILHYAIAAQDIKNIKVFAKDQFVTKDKYVKPKLVLTDLNGKKLGSRDYSLGNDTKFDTVSGNTVVTVTVNGLGPNYSGSIPVSFRLMDKNANISKARLMKKIPDQEYTGHDVTLARSDFKETLYTGKKTSPAYLIYSGNAASDDFEILDYSKNKEKGNAKVTVRGINKWAGTKIITFRITAKKAGFKGVLVGGKWRK